MADLRLNTCQFCGRSTGCTRCKPTDASAGCVAVIALLLAAFCLAWLIFNWDYGYGVPMFRPRTEWQQLPTPESKP